MNALRCLTKEEGTIVTISEDVLKEFMEDWTEIHSATGDSNLTWYTDNSDFTPCFQKTVLVWLPCAFLWPLSIPLFKNFKRKRDPFSNIDMTKTVLALLLASLNAFHFGRQLYLGEVETLDNLDTVIKFATYVLAVFLFIYGRRMGTVSSAIKLLFWFLSTVSETITYRSAMMNRYFEDIRDDICGFITETLSYSFVIATLVLNTISDRRPLDKKDFQEKEKPMKSPEEWAPFSSRMSYSWMNSFMWKGWKTTLEPWNVYDLNISDKAATVKRMFDKYWQYTQIHRSSDNIDAGDQLKRNANSIGMALFKTVWPLVLGGAVFQIFSDVAGSMTAPILRWILEYLSSDEPQWKGVFYASLFGLVGVAQSLLLEGSAYFHTKLGIRLKSLTTYALYKKTLRLSSGARGELSMGAILNTMYIDTDRFLLLIPNLGSIWSVPMQVILCTFFLYQELGVSGLVSSAIVVVFLPLSYLTSWKIKKLQVELMKVKDQRIKLTSEILNGIRVLKFYAWERSFQRMLERLKENEIVLLRKQYNLSIVSVFMNYALNSTAILASFAVFVLSDDDNVLTTAKAFVSFQLFRTICIPIRYFGDAINALIMIEVSVSRISGILNCGENEEYRLRVPVDEGNLSIEVTKGTFRWKSGEAEFLKDIDLKVSRGSLMAVMGPVGCGKSSLLSALLCEMEKVTGEVRVSGTVGYVSQQPWIRNTSLRNNILFVNDIDEEKYARVISSCALQRDLDNLPADDETEIGERGINLSGGQKQRVNIARAIYRNEDIYLLDDPLGALDSNVAKHIFDRVMGPSGLLRNQTRILVTHNVAFLREMDEILIMDKGRIVVRGSYDELTSPGMDTDYFAHHDKKSIFPPTESNQGANTVSVTAQVKLNTNEKITSKEVRNKGKTPLSVYKKYLKSYGFYSCMIVVVSQFSSEALTQIISYWLSLWSEDRKEGQPVNTHLRTTRLTVYALLGLTQITICCLYFLVSNLATLRATRALHSDMLRTVLRSPLSFFDSTPTGRLLNRFSQDIDVVDKQLPNLLRLVSLNTIQLAITSISIIMAIPLLIVPLMVIATGFVFLQRFYVASNVQLRRIYATRNSFLFSHASDSVAGTTLIRACHATNKFEEQFLDLIDQSMAAYYAMNMCERWLTVRYNILSNILMFCVFLFSVISKDRVLSPGTVGFVITSANLLIKNLKYMISLWASLETNIVAVERIVEYCQLETEGNWDKPETRVPPNWPERGEIVLQDYSTRYRQGLDLVLKNITVMIQPGEKVGVVGRTGAGKSSLTLALFRMVEGVQGHIVVDGVDLSTVSLTVLRSRMAIIPQDPVLFSGTLRLNLDPFKQHDDQRLWSVLEKSHLKALVASLEQGLDHPVAEEGSNLSVGQRQLVCLARALLRNSKILVLDEATASVDMDTDDLIQKTIRKEFASATVITIAHRINTIMDYDRVMVLDDGRIAEMDSPQNLLKNDLTLFYKLVKDAK